MPIFAHRMNKPHTGATVSGTKSPGSTRSPAKTASSGMPFSFSGQAIPVQRKEVGSAEALPENLRQGVESLSGVNMGDVEVVRNSPTPARLGALAVAQGKRIDLAPGQDEHLPHEAWHVAQQKQGRVKPTTSVAGTPVNSDTHLEAEADSMGRRAAAAQVSTSVESRQEGSSGIEVAQRVILQNPEFLGAMKFEPTEEGEGTELSLAEFLRALFKHAPSLKSEEEAITVLLSACVDGGSEDFTFDTYESVVDWLKEQGIEGTGEIEDQGGGSEEKKQEDVETDVGGQKVGKITFPGDSYHLTAKKAIIKAIGVKKLSFLVYKDKTHHNFNFWFESDGSIYADQNSDLNSKGKYTGYKWLGNRCVKDSDSESESD